jgi:hypothetical protein
VNPAGLCFDGTNIWVTNKGDDTVTKLLASTGATLGIYTVSELTTPGPIAFDGINVWVGDLTSLGDVITVL